MPISIPRKRILLLQPIILLSTSNLLIIAIIYFIPWVSIVVQLDGYGHGDVYVPVQLGLLRCFSKVCEKHHRHQSQPQPQLWHYNQSSHPLAVKDESLHMDNETDSAMIDIPIKVPPIRRPVVHVHHRASDIHHISPLPPKEQRKIARLSEPMKKAAIYTSMFLFISVSLSFTSIWYGSIAWFKRDEEIIDRLSIVFGLSVVCDLVASFVYFYLTMWFLHNGHYMEGFYLISFAALVGVAVCIVRYIRY